MRQDTHVSSVLVDAPFDAVWAWITDPVRFPIIYPNWTSEIRKVTAADGERYEGVAPNGDRFEIVPRLDRAHGVVDFGIVNEGGTAELSRAARVLPLKEGGCVIVHLAYRLEGVNEVFWEHFKAGTDTDLEHAKDVIERAATGGDTSPSDLADDPRSKEARRTDTEGSRVVTDGQEDTARRYPYESLESSGYDEALDELHASERKGVPHIPTFARRALKRLEEVGLLHTADTEPPANVRKVEWEAKDEAQELWMRFNTHRDANGYMAVEVIDATRSDAAILAAMIAYLAQPIDSERLLEAFRFFSSPAGQAQREKIEESMKRMREDQEIPLEEWKATMQAMSDLHDKIETLKPLQYIMPLIWYYKPAFDGYSPQQQQDLIEKTCAYINDFLDSLWKLQEFLEFGAPNRKLRPAIKEPQRDVRAAILCDVDGLTYREIGEQMGIAFSINFKDTEDHQTVRKFVERGREILKRAFGEEGWQKQSEAMKAQKAWWQSLSQEERDKERM